MVSALGSSDAMCLSVVPAWAILDFKQKGHEFAHNSFYWKEQMV